MTNIAADIAGGLTPADGQQLANIIIHETMPWYAILCLISIIGGLLVIPTIAIAGRIARKRGKPLQTHRTILQLTIVAILGIGSVNFLLGNAEALANTALLKPDPRVISMLCINLAQALKLFSASIGLATIGGIALIMTRDRKNE